MASDARYLYELTGNMGENLFKALRERDCEKVIEGQAQFYKKEAAVGSGMRAAFISEKLWPALDGDDLDEIRVKHPEVKGKDNKALKEWLESHVCPIAEEENMIAEWAWERANEEAQDGSLWDHFDHDNDAETALNMELVVYPPLVDGKYVKGGNNSIPARIANKIKLLNDEANNLESRNKDAADRKRNQAFELERMTVEGLVLVSGFDCRIHGGRAMFEKPVQKNEVLVCPSCGHPICPVCANAYSDNPKTEEDARRYLKSCDTVSGSAWCDHCGDYSEEFMKRFLRLVNCPIPQEYVHTKKERKLARFCMTTRVAALPDSSSIGKLVLEKFKQGTSGIIKVSHPTGDIWGFSERHPEGWVVTVLYPEER